jgi:hypothetical protein
MKRKFILLASLVLVFTLGFIYVNHNYISANGRDGKNTCTNMTGCTQHKSNTIKAGGEWSSYEFVTDKACTDEMQSSLKTELMNVAGVKDVKFSSTCSYSKMTNVSIYYSAGETSEETLQSFIKDKGFDCSGSGCEGKGCTPKNKKTDAKNI